MPAMRVRLEVATAAGREHLKTIETSNIPRVGEKIETGERQTFEVVEVVHTPLIRDWDAVVILKVVKIIWVVPLLHTCVNM